MTRSRSRRPRIVAALDFLEYLEMDVVFPALDRATARVERVAQPYVSRYLVHRAELAELDASAGRRRFAAEAAAKELEDRAAALRLAAVALHGLPISYGGPPPEDVFARLVPDNVIAVTPEGATR